MASVSARASERPMRVVDAGIVGYLEAWEMQRTLADQRAADLGDDTLLLLQHPSVYTAGRRTADKDRPTDGTPVIDVDRGGLITWHGPGQLVGYPIVKLASPIDVVQYVRRLEQALIEVCSNMGVVCGRVDGRSGVWLAAGNVGGYSAPERKIAAIGVRVQRGVAMHGFALNANPSLDAFDAIVPCGIADAGVTSLTRELGRDITVGDVMPAVATAVTAALDGALEVVAHDIDRSVPVSETGTSTEFTTIRFGA